MAWSKARSESRQDTGWGLIFRLNDLFRKIELDVEHGHLVKWDLHMDRIFVNILYKNDAEVIYDKDGQPIDFRFSKEDIDIFSKIQAKILFIKKKLNEAKRSEDPEVKGKYNTHLHTYYNILFKKDIWLRKKLFKLKLYLQQVEHDPRKAIYGG